jgi:hypothetical protein
MISVGWFSKKPAPKKVFPRPADVKTKVSPDVWAVSLGLVARIPGSLPEGNFIYQVVSVFDGGESSPFVTFPVTTHIEGSAVVITVQRGRGPRPLKYRILRENKMIAEIDASEGEHELFTDYLDTGEDLKDER